MRRAALAVLVFLLTTAQVPHRWSRRGGDLWFDADEAEWSALARTVLDRVERGVGPDSISTGSDRFDGEWLFGSYQMGGMGLAQVAGAVPAMRARCVAGVDRCVEGLLTPPVRKFDRDAWNEDALDSLAGDRGHAAYLGYLDLLLGLRRLVDPAMPHAPLHDRITEALARRLDRSTLGLLETYPGEIYPVDNASIFGALALHQRSTGSDHRARLERGLALYRSSWIDPATGLLIQSVRQDGKPLDGARGSGSALASYFLSFADPALSRELHEAVVRSLGGRFLGLGVVREYPSGHEGHGDIDSGPLILGYSISATGFTLGSARIHGDRETFVANWSTARLFGIPRREGDHLGFMLGGPLGDALMLAMLTAGGRK